MRNLIVITFFLSFGVLCNAQLKGDHLLGSMGLKSGTQVPENTLSIYIPAYLYNASSLKDEHGNSIAPNPDFTMFLTGLGGSWVSEHKIFGANWGASILVPFATNYIEGNFTNTESPFALSDIYIQPIQLGWHTSRMDYVFSYQMFIPTGKYELGASDNSGLGMFINELSGGATAYFDSKKTFHFSTLFSYEMHGKKKDTDIKTGDILTIEGGLGKTFYLLDESQKIPKSLINAGVVYYMQYKVTKDEIPNELTGNYIYGIKDKIMGLGVEANYFHISSNMSIGLRWFNELSAESRFKGNTFFITLAHVFGLKKTK
ncbi:transporter [Tamlana sp. 2_MG-2023]|uniref:SphA family protein n=1 Tax=unclassified Tamlana TaxID=2614803 RepID=UPI0026E121DB|nr:MULTISPECIES: transporter [unclassified Tamlana]MDO6760406.1 transporter [Tamlana sp. 2_MG-2023]MDO6789895.1 transporter [Tamlana sp. 1_MG-2023]